MRRLTLAIAALLMLGLNACEHKNKMTPAVDEKAYCREHPSECVMRAQDVQP